jgi:hypothetical protein
MKDHGRSTANRLGSSAKVAFVTEADWIPGFWNYLLNLDRNDLIAELIQNDLDQGATCTVVCFEQDHLVCEGNGRPIEADGWKRLRKIQGAGDSVPAKRGRIGVKNHGLKTAFTIGDEICLMSAGQAIVQTLYAKGRSRHPYPGASPEPQPDPQAPTEGCRITIRYRDADIEPRQGEANVLAATRAEDIDALFGSACASAPEQFAGVVSPEVAPRYEIVLRHWSLGEARFVFSCTRPRKIGKRIEVFRRRCTVTGTVSPLPDSLQEQAARRLVPLRGRLRQRVADFFRRSTRFFVEVSWSIDRRGKPRTGTGRFRYPIGYPHNSHEARTGHSTYFNAPFASDNTRHGPARNEATNKELRERCEDLLVDVLARHAIPRWGPDGLNALVPRAGEENRDATVRPLLAALVRQKAMPTLKWRDAVLLLTKVRKIKFPPAVRHPFRRIMHGAPRRYYFVVPVMRSERTTIHPSLSVITPRSEDQLDPRINPAILELLADGHTDGFPGRFVTFDENDALTRAAGEGNEYFGAPADLDHEFARPFVAWAYLTVIEEALMHDECDEHTEDALLEALRLPDVHGKPTRFKDLYASAPLPSDVPKLRLPPILHPDLVAHPLFRRRKWHRPKYTMARFLDGDMLQAGDAHTRRLFWNWLRRNEQLIGPRERLKLVDIAIWPDQNGHLCRIPDLCDPRSRRAATILADSIRRPHEHVRRSKLVSASSKARTSIRRMPTKDEIAGWLETRMAAFVAGEKSDAATTAALLCFESDLTVLLKDTAIARLLDSTGASLPALAQDGSVQQRTALVIPSRSIDRLALPGRFVLKDRQRAGLLDKLSPVLSAPTATMLLDTFAEDPGNFSALQPRLQQFMTRTEPGDDYRLQLEDMPILPAQGQPRAPSELAFMSNKGDYWGAWKIRISGKGLSQEDQRRYRAAGVTSALPDQETSRTFFLWLSGQDEDVLQRHVPCVLRHILHPHGPPRWAEVFTDVPFVPARSQRGMRLVSLRSAQRAPVYLPDAGAIGDAIIRIDSNVLLVIDHVKEVTEPVSEPLRKLGVRSLREALKEPQFVSGTGDIASAAVDVLAWVHALQSSQFRRTFLKRLDALGVESELVRHDWQDRLSRIKGIHFAVQVEARYHFRRKPYPVEVDAGFDPTSGIFWMKRDHGIGPSSLYEAIAAQLVFKPAARPVHLLALERALKLEIKDPSFGRPTGFGHGLNDNDGRAKGADQDSHDDVVNEETEAESDPGEAVFGHSPFVPDPTRNMPKPGPISSSPTGTSRRPARDGRAPGPSKDESDSRSAPELEKEHIEALKRTHYASHCQICLCERPPTELAPLGSYIQWEEVRRRVVDAHHVDLKSAGGARHAGNLILLCKLHHDNYGRRLTRAAVTAALECDTSEAIIRFGADDETVSEIKGRQIELVIPDNGETVKMFFTREHAAYWLSQASTSESNAKQGTLISLPAGTLGSSEAE